MLNFHIFYMKCLVHFFFLTLNALGCPLKKIKLLCSSLDRERSLVNDDPKWLDTTFVLANYKTELCKKPPRLCRQGYACPQYHNGKDKRRSPKKYKYRSTPCPQVLTYRGGKEDSPLLFTVRSK